MAGFLYFRSGDSRPIVPEDVHKLGLGYILDASTTIENRALRGASPSGKSGLLFQATDRGNPTLRYDADAQDWGDKPLPSVNGRPEMHIGYWKDAKPGPEDLARATMLDGVRVRMADDKWWHTPITRSFDEEAEVFRCELPAYLDYDENGKVCRGKVLEKYRELWELTAPLAQQQFELDATGEGGLDEDQVYAAVVALFKANYVVDLPELARLQVLADNESLSYVALASCRYKQLLGWIEQVQKKSEPQQTENGSDSSDGETG